LIDIPKDIQNQVTEYQKVPPVFLEKYRLPDVETEQAEQLEQAVKAIRKAHRPVLYVGGGTIISGASALVVELAEKASIPVTTTLMATGAFPGTHELSLGMLGMHGTRAANYAMDQADLIIACGARFDDRVTGKVSEFAKNATIIHIEIDPAEISKIIRAHLPIRGDVKQVLAAILKRLAGAKISRHKKWHEQITAWRRTYPLTYGSSEKAIKPQFVIEELYRVTEGKAIITTDVGQHQMWAAQFYKFHNPRSFISSGGLGTMGYGFPAALGAQVAFPERPVFTIAGDGSFLMNIQELATASEYRIPVKVAIINNGYLGMVRQWQEIFFSRRYSQVDLNKGNPDFVMVAHGFGVEGIRVTKENEVRPALEKALAIKGPVVLDIHVDQEENVFPMVPSGGSAKDIIG
jgi:acetolactate synthase-1/2/3 large subunit